MNNKCTQQRRAVLYLRSARDDEPASNIQRQRTACHAFARAHGLVVSREYVDVGSGVNDQRPGLTRLLDDLEQSDASVVIVWDMARLGRDPVVVANLLRTLSDLGVKVMEVSSGQAVSTKEIFMLGLRALIERWADEAEGVRQ